MSRTSLLSFFSLTVAFTLMVLANLPSSVQGEEIISGKFGLMDHTGRPVDEASYKGKLRLVFFGFTNCPDICPTTMMHITKVMKMLGKQGRQVQPLFITIDHRNDTVERIASYVSVFHPAITGLTGTEEQIRDATAAFNVNYGLGSEALSGSAGEFYHSSYLYLMDREGKFIDLFGYGTRAKIIVSKLNQYLD